MINWLFRKVFRTKKPSVGATLIEYALVAALIVMFIIGGLRTVGERYVSLYNNVNGGLDS
ncbi:MAG: hypothetical protein LBB21_03815 [Holosporaceae bacterium]|jgi:Flp pilus assembly pilin Flp|nr:hypothetical protein [Holosporaceae bacterium]